ncbi:MAG TPA: ABC transporter substrate-binding protein, partial [Bradyrhizobium sp.]|nr:ABC transporter substrate-binding protein [Bradyrhizobium sp.]
MDRRQFLRTTGLVVAAGSGALAAPALVRAQGAPIKIGLMAPQTGVVAAGGREIIDGFQLFWETVNNEAGGRKVEILVEDDASNPDTAL